MDDFLKTIPIKKMEADIINDKSLSLADKAILLDGLRNASANRQYGAISGGDLARGLMQAGLYSGLAYGVSKLINKIYSLPTPVANSIINMAGFGGFLKGVNLMDKLNKSGMQKEARLSALADLITFPLSKKSLLTAFGISGTLLYLLHKLKNPMTSYEDVLLEAKLRKVEDLLRGLKPSKRRAGEALVAALAKDLKNEV